jgi:hypothetical protein
MERLKLLRSEENSGQQRIESQTFSKIALFSAPLSVVFVLVSAMLIKVKAIPLIDYEGP